MKIMLKARVFQNAFGEDEWTASAGDGLYGTGRTPAHALAALKDKVSSGGDDVTITIETNDRHDYE